MKNNRILLLIILLPILGCLGLIGQKEFTHAHSTVIRAPIVGYDPRDLMMGHFLRFQFAPEADASLPRIPRMHQYYIPESDALRLSALLRDKEHILSVDARDDGHGSISFDELYIDGTPWQIYFVNHPQTGQ